MPRLIGYPGEGKNLKLKNIARCLLAGFSLFLSGCITEMGYFVEDHTLGVLSNPVSAPGGLLWRVKTFTGETLDRIQVKFFHFPRLEKIPVPTLDPNRPFMPSGSMSKWLSKKYGPSVSAELKLLISGQNFFPRLEERLAQAKKSIKIHTYIFDNDDVAKKLADQLKEKSNNKVKTMVILDWFASKHAWNNKAKTLSESFEVIPNMVSYLKQDSRINVHRSTNLWLSSDHSKMILIDGQTLFFGGMNIGREYRYEWRDMMVEAEGPIVSVFNRAFNWAWLRTRFFSDFLYFVEKEKRKKVSRRKGAIRCHVLTTTPFRHQIYKSQLHAARSAMHHIYVENPYLWNHRFIYALCQARKRGVDVRVTVPSRLDFAMFQGATSHAINTLLHHGVRVFLYPGMTHVKAAVYDDWVCFGSANFDDLSMHKNYEINLSTDDPSFARKMEEDLLLKGQAISREIRKPVPVTFFDSLSWEIKDYL